MASPEASSPPSVEDLHPHQATSRRFDSMSTWDVKTQHYTTRTRSLCLNWEVKPDEWLQLNTRCLRAKNCVVQFSTDTHTRSDQDQAECLLCEFVRTLEQNLERLGQFGGILEDVEYPEVLLERFQFTEEMAAAMSILLDFLDPVDAVDPRQFPGTTHYDNSEVFLRYYAKTNEVLLCLEDRTIQRWIGTYAPLLLSQMNRTWNWWHYSCLKPIATEAESSLSRVRLTLGRKFPFVSRAPIVVPPMDQPQRGIRLLFQWELEPQDSRSPTERRVRLEEDHHGHRWVFIFSWEPVLPCQKDFFLYQHGKFWNVFVVAQSHAHAVSAGLLDGGQFNYIHDTAQVVVASEAPNEALPTQLHAEMPPLPTSPPVFAYVASMQAQERPKRTYSALDVLERERPTAASVAQRAMQGGERRRRGRANSLCELPRAAELVRAESLESGKGRRRRLSGFRTLRLGKKG